MSKRPTFNLPTIAAVSNVLFATWTREYPHAEPLFNDRENPDEASEGEYLDFRVWATSSNRGHYASMHGIEYGSPDYDQIHGDICSAGSLLVSIPPDRKVCDSLAREIISDLYSQRAEFQSVARAASR